MPARDVYHHIVVHALIADGWKITDDPLLLSYGGRDLYVDLGAEYPPIAAEKDGQKIAVEIKSFLGPSVIHDLEDSIGQYQTYRIILSEIKPERLLYLAIPQRVYEGIFMERLGQLLLNNLQLRLMVFDETQERIITWIP